MKLFSKLLLITLSITLIRLLVGCCSCKDEFYTFNYQKISIHNIDNSGQWSKPSELNIMPAEGVAFEIQILGSEPILTAQRNFSLNGFNTLSAQTCTCDELFVPANSITAIKIRTLLVLNDDFCCNEEVTNLFLANSCFSCEDIGNFYVTMDELIPRINPEAFYQKSINKFLIYLSVPVKNDEAQFEIEMVLSNGESIIAQTELISII